MQNRFGTELDVCPIDNGQ